MGRSEKISESKTTFEILVSEATEFAFNMLYEKEFEPVYLYYIPGDFGKYGRLIPIYDSDSHKNLELACNERLPRSLSHDQLRGWIKEKSKYLPILPKTRS